MLTNWIFAAVMLFSGEKPSVTVLCYHAFNDNKNVFSFSLDELKGHVKFFKDRGYRFVTYSEFAEGKISGNRNILVTIDDGNKSVYAAYHEVFKPAGIKPVLGIYPAIIERKHYALTWAQLKELSDAGCEIAGHGYNHLFVRQKLYDKDRKAFMREIYLSKSILEDKLGRKVRLYIYPFGVRSKITIDHLKKAGYDHAFTIVNGRADVPVPEDTAYELPRYMLTRPTWAGTFAVIDKKQLSVASRKGKTSMKKNPAIKSKRKHAKV